MSENTNQEKRDYTEAEILEIRKKTIAHYEEQESVLRIQCLVEKLKAGIKKAQFEALEYSIKFMQLSFAMQEADKEAEAEENDKGADLDIDKKE